ncbi:hypothetical protein LGM14_08645 [Burkholderia multivorans]|nr:hypothetical protein [Burkholderia multivorans]
MTLGSSVVHQVSAQARIIDRAYVLRGIAAQAMREARRAGAGCFSLGGSPAFQRERSRLRDADESATIGQSYSAAAAVDHSRRCAPVVRSAWPLSALAGAQTTSTEPWSSQ